MQKDVANPMATWQKIQEQKVDIDMQQWQIDRSVLEHRQEHNMLQGEIHPCHSSGWHWRSKDAKTAKLREVILGHSLKLIIQNNQIAQSEKTKGKHQRMLMFVNLLKQEEQQEHPHHMQKSIVNSIIIIKHPVEIA